MTILQETNIPLLDQSSDSFRFLPHVGKTSSFYIRSSLPPLTHWSWFWVLWLSFAWQEINSAWFFQLWWLHFYLSSWQISCLPLVFLFFLSVGWKWLLLEGPWRLYAEDGRAILPNLACSPLISWKRKMIDPQRYRYLSLKTIELDQREAGAPRKGIFNLSHRPEFLNFHTVDILENLGKFLVIEREVILCSAAKNV